MPLRWDDGIVQRELSSEDRISRLGRVAHAQAPRWISGYISLKEPHGPALWWHQDWGCWDHPVSFAPATARAVTSL